MTDTATPAELNHHLDILDAQILACEMFLQQTQGQPSTARTAEIRKLSWLLQNHGHFSHRLAKKTGNNRVPPSVSVYTQEEHRQATTQNAQDKQAQEARNNVRNIIETIEAGLQRFSGAVQAEYAHAHSWGINFVLSDLCRVGAGVWWREPLILQEKTVPQVKAALKQARKALDENKLKTALAAAAIAQKWLNWGEMRFNMYLDRVQEGGERVVFAIKITTTIATAIVTGGATSGGLAMGLTEGAVMGAVGEGSQQATDLVLKGIDSGYSVSGQDIYNAVMETAIASTVGSISEGAKMTISALAGNLSTRIATRILGRAPSANEVAFVTDRFASVVSANYAQFVKKAAALDADPNWDAWDGIIAPLLGGMTAEVIKDAGVRKPFVEAVESRL